MTRLTCDDCGCGTRRPAIDLSLRVFCVACAPRHGMYPGEHNSDVRSYDAWKARAAEVQGASR